MYFGYQDMSRFTFVPAGFVIVMLGSLAFAFVYLVGSTMGKRPAAAYTSVTTYAVLAVSVADLAYGAVSGDLSAFTRAYGIGPLVEMSLLALMCVGSLWFMAVSYVNSKKE